MLKKQFLSPVVRAIFVMGAVAALVTGVTFAVLASETTLTENALEGADALQVNNDPEDTNFSPFEPGFTFENIVPGIAPSQTETFQLKNTSTTPVNVYVQIPDAPVLPVGVTGSEITFTFTPETSGVPVPATWAELTTGDGVELLNELGDGSTETITVRVEVAGTATAESINVPNFTLLFGVPVVAS